MHCNVHNFVTIQIHVSCAIIAGSGAHVITVCCVYLKCTYAECVCE